MGTEIDRHNGPRTADHRQRSSPTDCPTTPAGIAWGKSLFRKPKRAVRKVGQAFQPDSDRPGPGPTTAGVRLESLTYAGPAWISSLREQTPSYQAVPSAAVVRRSMDGIPSMQVGLSIRSVSES